MLERVLRQIVYGSLAAILAIPFLVSPGWTDESETAASAAAVSAASESAAPEDESVSDRIFSPFKRVLPQASLDGYLLSSYRGRWSDDDDDQDFYQYMLLDMRNLIPQHLDAEVSMRFHEDFNDSNLNFSDDLFIDIDDPRDDDWPDRLSTAWIDLYDIGYDGSSLRVGRQYLPEFDGLHIDGARLSLERLGPFDFTAFGGRPVTYFSGVHGDATYGFSGNYRITPWARVRAKYYRYSDDSLDLDDDQAEVELWLRREHWAFFHASLGTLDSDLKDMILDGKLVHDEWNTYLTLRYYRLFTPIGENTIEFSPFFAVLDELEPFSRSDIRLTKRFGEIVDVFGGISIRREEASNDSDGDVTNSDYERYDAGLTFYPTPKWAVTGSGQYWNVDAGRRFTGVTSEVTFIPWKELTLSAGNAYGEYRNEYYDSFRQLEFRERPDVLTYFASLKWRVTPNATFRSKFEIEDSDIDDDEIYRLQSSIGIRF